MLNVKFPNIEGRLSLILQCSLERWMVCCGTNKYAIPTAWVRNSYFSGKFVFKRLLWLSPSVDPSETQRSQNDE